MEINAAKMDYRELNNAFKNVNEHVIIKECRGQRFIADGASSQTVEIIGVPGNALGAYLNGASIMVKGNVQDAVGDTMNEGKIIVDGSAGDALGYAMRGGRIYIKGNAGYRTGIHMKQYGDKKPVIVVGGCAGSFLGEYLAGGIIVVLGLNKSETDSVVGNFTGTGMHGGKIYLRSDRADYVLPEQVCDEETQDLSEIEEYLEEFSRLFGIPMEEICSEKFHVLKPNVANPYKKMYVAN